MKKTLTYAAAGAAALCRILDFLPPSVFEQTIQKWLLTRTASLLIVGCVFLSVPFSTSLLSAQTLEDDRLALVAFYNATNGAGWTNNTGWVVPGTPGDDPCGWFGISCAGGRVIKIELRNNNLSGPLPPEIGNLDALHTLDYHSNKVSGAIPLEIGNLSNLSLWIATINQHTGSIPVEIGNLSNLSQASLDFNDLDGEIPSVIGNLTNLVVIHLMHNNLTGPIPPEIGSLTKLEHLKVYNNQLSGDLPVEIGNLSNLSWLHANNNNHTRCLPPELGGLSNLNNLFFSFNDLNGPIPSEYANLSKATLIYLPGNNLSGPVPDFSGVPNLNSLLIETNAFTFEGMKENLSISNFSYHSQAIVSTAIFFPSAPAVILPIILTDGIKTVVL